MPNIVLIAASYALDGTRSGVAVDGGPVALSSGVVRGLAALSVVLAVASCDLVTGLTDFSIGVAPPPTGSGGQGGSGGDVPQGGQGGETPPPPCVLDVATRLNTSCAVLRDETLWCWGQNGTGQLGNGSLADSVLPVVAQAANVVAVSLGPEFLVALHGDGTVETWGENQDGQLGNGQSGSRQLQGQIVNVSDVVEIGAGRSHACGRTDAGAVRCWGANHAGQCGRDPTAIPIVTTPWEVLDGAKALAVGSRHTCLIRQVDDNVICWGSNESGQLGVPIGANYEHVPQALSEKADALALGGSHTCALRNQRVRCWGDNVFWQLGDGSGTADPNPRDVVLDGDVIDIAAAGRKTCARLDNGNVWCWGESGQPTPQDATPIALALPAVDGELAMSTLLSPGSYHLCARRQDGTLWCRGRNAEGQLGNGLTSDSKSLVEAQLTCP